MAEKHWVSEENLQAYHTKVVGSKTDKTADPNGTIYQRLNAQKEIIGHLLILRITFSEEFKGKAYTVTGNGETFTGTVPDSLYINLHVHGLDTIYTVSAEYESETYTSEVETKDFFGVYFGELTAWQATITVTVTDAVAGAVEGALVTATSTEKEYTRTTNTEGKAEIKVGKSGTYTIVAKNADGELTDTQEVVADTDKGTYTAEVSYWRATLTVTVTDKGVGVADAKVTAASADKTYGPVTTDAEGKATIKIGKAGTYTVKAVNAEGEETNPKPVEITTAGETYTVSCTYFAASIVVTADISHAPNTTNNVLTLKDSAGNKQTQAISANGDYTFYVYESGAYSVYYTNGLAKSNTKSIDVTESTVYTASVLITKVYVKYVVPTGNHSPGACNVYYSVNDGATQTVSGDVSERHNINDTRAGGLVYIYRQYHSYFGVSAIANCTDLSKIYKPNEYVISPINNGSHTATVYSA